VNKPEIYIIFNHACTYFFYFSISPIFLYFLYFFSIFVLFLGLGPAQPTWAGLDPASPAQPSHWPKPVTRLGHTRHTWSKSRVHGPCYWIKKNKQREWSKEKREKQSRRRTWCVCRGFAQDCWRRYFWSEFSFTPSACLPRCIPFLRLCFGLIFFVLCYALFFRTPSLSLLACF